MIQRGRHFPLRMDWLSPRLGTRRRFSSCGGHLTAAEVHGQCDPAGGLAATERNARESCGETLPDLFLRSLLPGPWGHGNRLESMGAKFGNPAIFVSLVECADRIIVE